MKGIFSICLLFTTAVSESAKPGEVNGIVGRSVTFPATVKKGGSLMFSDETIGDVTNRKFTPLGKEKSRGRLQWDSSSGFFSLSQLTMQDIGEYKVQNTDLNKNTVFQLNVYEGNVPVSKPQVNITYNEHPCNINCSVERGTGVTLSWYREGEKRPLVSSSVRDAYMDLPVPVERSGTYTCKAKNSVSNETSDPLTVEDHCTGAAAITLAIAIGVSAFLVLIFIIVIAVVIHRRCHDSSTGRKGAGTSKDEATRLAEKPSAESSS